MLSENIFFLIEPVNKHKSDRQPLVMHTGSPSQSNTVCLLISRQMGWRISQLRVDVCGSSLCRAAGVKSMLCITEVLITRQMRPLIFFKQRKQGHSVLFQSIVQLLHVLMTDARLPGREIKSQSDTWNRTEVTSLPPQSLFCCCIFCVIRERSMLG